VFLLFLLPELSVDLCKFPHRRVFFLRLNRLFSLFSLCVVVVVVAAVVVVGIMASTDAPVMDSISDAVAASSHHAVLCLLLLFFTFCFVLFCVCLYFFILFFPFFLSLLPLFLSALVSHWDGRARRIVSRCFRVWDRLAH
jgi:hypothetical protein